jgi:tRNA threonylcarbamoyladenosine biosynthesis protein TsaE
MSPVSMQINLADSGATEALGRALARSLPIVAVAATPGGAVLHLTGELGAGKTTAVRALLRTLGVDGPVRSPTYTLIETYALPGLSGIHVDLYRLQSLAEVDELGLRDLQGPGAVLFVEWPERGGASVPAADVVLALHYEGEARKAHLSAMSVLGRAWLDNLRTDTSLSFYVSNLT